MTPRDILLHSQLLSLPSVAVKKQYQVRPTDNTQRMRDHVIVSPK